jgi:hypothetical protein
MDYFKCLSILSGKLFKANFFFIFDSLNFLLSFCVLFLFLFFCFLFLPGFLGSHSHSVPTVQASLIPEFSYCY